MQAAPLSEKQRAAVELAKEGRNCFVTGSGGVGKSFLLETLIAELEALGKRVHVTASTGIAAVNVGGTTLHAWAGVGLGAEPVEELVVRLRFQKKAKARWACDVLVIDEVSMLDADFFDKLNAIGKRLRQRQAAFGGIQLVLCGDFFQLPPVSAGARRFVFQSVAWHEAQLHWIELTEVFRQADRAFVSVLERVRWGRLDAEVLATLQARVGAQLDTSDGIEPTRLYSTNAQVDRINADQLAALPGDAVQYRCRQTFSKLTGDERQKIGDKVAKDCAAQPLIELKIGAQVMLLANLNLELGLCNGSRGVVVRFADPKPTDVARFRAPIVRFVNGAELPIAYYAWRVKSPEGWSVLHEQLPLRLAWAMTIHKSQGMTLEKVEMSLNVFERGQAYVALSRVRSLDGLSISNLRPEAIRAEPAVVELYEQHHQ